MLFVFYYFSVRRASQAYDIWSLGYLNHLNEISR